MNGAEQIEARRESPETVLATVANTGNAGSASESVSLPGDGYAERPRDMIESVEPVTAVAHRPFTCTECHGHFAHDGARGPLPVRCKECRRKHINAGSQSRKTQRLAARG